MDLRDYIALAQNEAGLSESDMREAMEILVSGEADEAQMAAFLSVQATRGITTDELKGAVAVLHQKKKKFELPDSISQDDIVDCCGTGGDGKHTLNVSTAVAFVVAGAGVPVVKHGNRSVSSKSGSSDVLTELGVNVNASDDTMREALLKANVCFLNAPNFHPAMKHVAAVRKKLGIRTVFNLLGPLVNPAEPRRQLIGVYDEQWMEPFANLLRSRGASASMIVHAQEGYDELSLLSNKIVAFGVVQDLLNKLNGTGVDYVPNITGGEPQYNAQRLREVLSPNGVQDDYWRMVLLNTTATLLLSGKGLNFDEAADLAQDSIQSGAAPNALNPLVEITSA